MEEPLADLARRLPPAPRPQGAYVPAVVDRGLVLTAGMTPRVDGVIEHPGRVGDEVTLEEAQRAASIAAGNALSAAVSVLGPGRRLGRVLRMTVYVNAAPGFLAHSAVADGASSTLVELLGERGAAARTAVGVTTLPGSACVELDLTATVEDG